MKKLIALVVLAAGVALSGVALARTSRGGSAGRDHHGHQSVKADAKAGTVTKTVKVERSPRLRDTHAEQGRHAFITSPPCSSS